MHRHQQRDLEAGGPGRGTLDTRKRAWKGPDGSVVDKRPRLTDPGSPAPPWSSAEPESSLQVVSPPVSDEGRFGHEYQSSVDNRDDTTGFIDPVDVQDTVLHSTVPYFQQPQFEDYLQPTLPTSRPQPSSQNGHFEYHPAFQPDTASSFNMPYTTALDYNWLFNIEAATASGFGLTSCGAAFQDQSPFYGHGGMGHRQNTDMATQQQVQNPTPESQSSSNSHPSVEEGLNDSPRRESPIPTTLTSSSRPNLIQPRIQQSQERSIGDIPTNSGPQIINGQMYERVREDVSTRRSPGNHQIGFRVNNHTGSCNLREPERPLSMLKRPDLLPQLDEATRERMLVVVESSNPNIPDQPLNSSIRDHPILSLGSLQSWLDLFFTHFNAAYPLIHMPTFDPSQTEPLLLLSVLLLGATYSDKGAHQVAVCIHDVIRPSIFAHAGFSPRPELWTLQTILLVECFGKSRAGQRQHDMSHLFHGLLINLIRRSDCQTVLKQPRPPPLEAGNDASLDDTWKRWAESEQKKRLALLCFMWDTQHAVLFCQSLCMSAFELRCAMPCSQIMWESPDAVSWATIYHRSTPSTTTTTTTTTPSNAAGPLFLPTLKSYLSPGVTPRVSSDINVLSLVLVLHGIMSVAWDMQRRDQTSLGVNSVVGRTTWRDLISDAYDRWKVDFDKYCADAAAISEEGTTTSEWLAFGSAYKAVYHAAQALLHMDFLDMQIYAGARHILGRPVQQQDYIRSSRVVKRWAANDRERAAVAAWHAASMLCDVVAAKNKPQLGSVAEADLSLTYTHTNLFHVPWCIYLATLTCWAFHHAKPSRKDRGGGGSRERYEEVKSSFGDDSDDSDEIVWNPQMEMETLVKHMAGSGNVNTAVREVLSGQDRRGTNGLVWVVADLLSKVRWGIVHAGVVVLRGLVPTRLINQYETL